MAPRFYVETYEVKPTRRVLGVEFPINAPTQHGWRAKAKGNHEILAAGEHYVDKRDMLDTLNTLFGPLVEIRAAKR